MKYKHYITKAFNLWPPFLGAGIKIHSAAPDFLRMEVHLRLLPWTRNYVGSHFGGSLYAMTDPFYMVMLIQNLGKDYIVWDKAASIQFKKPGRGLVRAVFELSEQQIDDIRAALATEHKVEPKFHVDVLNAQNEVVASVEKTLYVRRKPVKNAAG